MQQLKSQFNAYAVGAYYASACTSLGDDEAVKCMRTEHPIGRWRIADEAFASGDPNGTPCAHLPTTHRHVLFAR